MIRNVLAWLEESAHRDPKHIAFEDENTARDARRTAFLNEYGIAVLRIPNCDVNRNFRSVCEYIDAAVRQSLKQSF